MALSIVRFGLRSVVSFERNAAVFSVATVPKQFKIFENDADKGQPFRVMYRYTATATATYTKSQSHTWDKARMMMKLYKLIHTKTTQCNGIFCYLADSPSDRELHSDQHSVLRRYSKQHGRPEEDRRKHSDSDSDSDSNTECKGFDRSEFWRRKMRTVHNILDVDKDGLISFDDFVLFAERFKSLGHLTEQQAQEFTSIIKLTWEEQWGAIDPYNFVTVEQYLEDMHHVLNDKTLKKKAHRWLPYLFKAVDKDKSGYISVHEFKLFFQCLGLDNEHAAVAFAVIDVNGDGKVSQKEFVKLGKEFFCTDDDKRVSKMFWGPLIN